MNEYYSVGFFDYLMIAVYFAFMLVIGIVFRKMSKDTSDYLRGGGSMTWWMTGGSAFVTSFSAWTFVGCAGKVYKTGSLIIILFFFSALAMLLVALFFAHRFRRMRVITPIEAVRHRFGFASEQVYAWQSSIMAFVFGGIGLYILAVFIAPILGMNIHSCIVMVGIAITFLSVTGGSWAVVTSDFVQMLVILTITIVAAVLVLNMPEVGGISGFLDKLPSYHFNWAELAHPRVVGLWIIAIFLNQIFSAINLTAGASRFLYVQSDSHARKAALLVMVGCIVGPLIWFIPPMAASFVIPEIAEQFSYLKNPEEAAYVAICMRILPQGLIGLLACGIFAATVSSMNTGLNINSGIIIRNIYKPLFRRDASERELLLAARLCTLLLGVWTIFVGVWFSKWSEMPLFEWTMLLAGLITIPMTIPLVLGFFVRRTPGWSAWSTILIGLLTAYLVKFHLSVQWIAGLIGIARELSKQETRDVQFAAMVIIVFLVASTWFLLSRHFYRRATQAEEARIAEFFRNLDTPVTADSDEHRHTDTMQYKMVGLLCLAYGGFVLAGVLIPNPVSGRLSFAFCGGAIMAVGTLLYRIYRRKRARPLS